ncbi:MAG: hypothetical protein E7272_07850 [Pseudobutyrivibrio ruminis]|uniref:Uncharacterized protein n=1 Tax=Pseudobutyrivibrio ruminis TaxID=46206 RepID=A0A927U839_9FIRM|nr:hypothetical protein [Pseudobutyrivibrio ruminis]
MEEKKRRRGKGYTTGLRSALVELVLNGGAVTYRSLRLLSRSDRHYFEELIRDMAKDDVFEISTSKRLKYATIKDLHKLELLTSQYGRNGSWKSCGLNEELLTRWKEKKKEDGEEIGRYKDLKKKDKNRYRVETNTAAIRKYKEAEVSQIMWHLKFNSLLTQKPSIARATTPALLDMNAGYYYTFEEVRKNSNYRVETDEQIMMDEQIMNSRAIGSLFCSGGSYVIYHFGRELQMWNKFQENIYKMATRRVAKEKMGMYLEADRNKHPIDGAIILGYQEGILSKLLNPAAKTDVTHQSKIMDSEYQNIFYVPVDRNGYYQLSIYKRKDWMEEMKKHLIPYGFDTTPSKLGKAAHGKGVEDGINKVVYLFTNNNVKELLFFIDRAAASPKTSYQIVAWRYMAGLFEFDVELPENIEMKYIDIEDYIKKVGING